jgi:K+-sensing histidine kinase KdpD
VLYYSCANGKLSGRPVCREAEGDGGFSEADLAEEQEAAAWAGRNGKHAGRTTRKWPQAKCLYMAIRSESGVQAVVGIRADNAPSIDEYRKNLMISILDECALAIEKEHMTQEKQRMEENARRETLRANLLRAISHDLRTPLTSISGNATLLMENLGNLSEAKRAELYASIYDDAIWLNGLVENLLTITSYVDTLLILCLVFGIVFELPVLAWLLARFGLLRAEWMSRYRRHAIVAILIVAAIITPTADALTLVIVALPIWLLYEVSVLEVKTTQ